MTNLSPQAQAVLDAYARIITSDPHGYRVEVAIAAALEALTDQVVPANGSRKNNEIRAEILAIAAELESGR